MTTMKANDKNKIRAARKQVLMQNIINHQIYNSNDDNDSGLYEYEFYRDYTYHNNK